MLRNTKTYVDDTSAILELRQLYESLPWWHYKAASRQLSRHKCIFNSRYGDWNCVANIVAVSWLFLSVNFSICMSICLPVWMQISISMETCSRSSKLQLTIIASNFSIEYSSDTHTQRWTKSFCTLPSSDPTFQISFWTLFKQIQRTKTFVSRLCLTQGSTMAPTHTHCSKRIYSYLAVSLGATVKLNSFRRFFVWIKELFITIGAINQTQNVRMCRKL